MNDLVSEYQQYQDATAEEEGAQKQTNRDFGGNMTNMRSEDVFKTSEQRDEVVGKTLRICKKML